MHEIRNDCIRGKLQVTCLETKSGSQIKTPLDMFRGGGPVLTGVEAKRGSRGRSKRRFKSDRRLEVIM